MFTAASSSPVGGRGSDYRVGRRRSLAIAWTVAVVLATLVAGFAAPASGAWTGSPSQTPPVDSGILDTFDDPAPSVVAQQTGATANLTITPSTAHPGDVVVLDGTDSSAASGENVTECQFDANGDGDYEVVTQTCVYETTYQEVGEYEVGLRILTSEGVSATDTGVVAVQRNRPPVAAFEADPTEAYIGQNVTLSAAGSADPDGSIQEYAWIVGETAYEGERVTVSPEATGEVEVSLQVIDDDGAENATVGSILVRENTPPTAALTISPVNPTVGETVTLDASDSTDAEGPIVAYRWDVDGDGTVDRETETATTTVTVERAGGRSASVAVVDEREATDEAAVEYTVVEPTTPTPTDRATETPATGRDDSSGLTGIGFLDGLDVGLVPFVPDWLALILLAVGGGLAVTVRREDSVRSRLEDVREKVHSGQFRKKVAKSASGFVAKTVAKKFLRRGADVVEFVTKVVGDAIERIGRAIKNGGERVASFLRKLGG